MCGRYVSVARRADLLERYEATGAGDGKELTPSWNVAPTSKVYTVVERVREDGAGTVREVRAVRWGLLPAWWKPGIDPKTHKAKTMPSLHNARADRVATAPSWRGPFARRRAVIPAAGYYEWLPGEDADGKPLLWSAAIITHHATWLAGVMNDRSPVILPPDRIDAWLDPDVTDKAAVQKLISGIEYEPLQVRAVSTAVNKTGRGASRGPELIEPIDEHGDQPLQLVPA